jgi:hypothetical protein
MPGLLLFEFFDAIFIDLFLANVAKKKGGKDE